MNDLDLRLYALRDATDALERGAPVPPAAAEYLSDSINRYLAGQRLEAAFGLELDPGQKHPATAAEKSARDQMVRDMASAIPGGVASKVRRMRALVTDPSAAETDHLRITALALRGRLPKSDKRLAAILYQESCSSNTHLASIRFFPHTSSK